MAQNPNDVQFQNTFQFMIRVLGTRKNENRRPRNGQRAGRTLGILELLTGHPAGLPVGAIAARLDMPPSAAHRLLNDLARFGYVRQDRAQGDYALTIKLAAMGLSFLGQSGITDVAQPILDRLAAERAS